MQKKKLERLRTLNATKAMIDALKEPGKEQRYDGELKEFRYKLAMRCQQLNGILKVSICTREDIEEGIITPKWDIFINYEGDEYTTRERQEDGTYKWREAMIYNLDNLWYWKYHFDEWAYINPEGSRSIRQILETNTGGWEGIYEWQKKCKRRQEDKKIKRQTEQWDKAMKPIKETPKGFENWWHHKAFDGMNYIFYAAAGAKRGFCTSCLKEIQFDHLPKHNAEERCPQCHRLVTYISRAKKTIDLWTYPRIVSCIQRYKEGLVQREFSVRRIDSKKNVEKPVFTSQEIRRTLILKDGYQVYEWEDYRKRGMRWSLDSDQRIQRRCGMVYPKNIAALLKNTHTAYKIAAEHGYYGSGLLFFLAQERKYPVIEMVYKAGLYKLGKEMIDSPWLITEKEFGINMEQHELAKILGIDKSRMKRLKKMEGGLNTLRWLQDEKRNNTVYRDEDIEVMSQITRLDPKEKRNYLPLKYMSLEKVCNYIRKQMKIEKRLGVKNDLKSIYSDWDDYISMMEEMKMDCSKEILLKPKDLIVEHNEMVARLSMKNSSEKIKQIKEKYMEAQKIMQSGELKKYEYEDKRYCIVAPTGVEDIYHEGSILKHCIHTCERYFEKIDTRETYLLFLRRKEDKERPWYTLEVEPGGNIRQKKSVLNEAYEDLKEAMPFLEKWQQWVKKNLSEKDKKLAEASNSKRKADYKQLREEKKLIWHGRLQGTLLADALEDDFMEVG